MKRAVVRETEGLMFVWLSIDVYEKNWLNDPDGVPSHRSVW